MTTSEFRLDPSIDPELYEIKLHASPKRAWFEGSMLLHAKACEPLDVLKIHGRKLDIASITLWDSQGRQLPKFDIQADDELIVISPKRPLRKGKFRLKIDYRAQLSPGMHGLYAAGEKSQKALVSQCEASDARAIFPCLDEPSYKAKIQWTISTDPDFEVIANGALLRKRSGKDKKNKRITVHHFAPTPPISSYLAAVTIGRYLCGSTQTVCRIPSKIWMQTQDAAQTDFAQSVTAWVLPWYEKFFGQRYPYDKLDQVAVGGFDAGAMENVGAIFYRQSLLLCDPNVTSWAGKKRIAEVVAHELAHQWFGNLVTMVWWDDLWLNEAFATWIAFKAMDVWQPDWCMWEDFLFSKESALQADSLSHTHPVYTPVQSPAQATELFDVITYEKGCAVLRMLEAYLGADIFRDGIRSYQKRYKQKNARGADLWQCLEEVSGKKLQALMGAWVSHSGFPCVTFERLKTTTKARFKLSQTAYGASKKIDKDTTLWPIPITVRYAARSAQGKIDIHLHTLLLRDQEKEIALPHKNVLWALPNASGAGFFRTTFGQKAHQDLLSHASTSMDPGDAMTLLNDAWAQALHGQQDIVACMDWVAALANHPSHTVAATLAGILGQLDQSLVAARTQKPFQKYLCALFAPAIAELGFEPKDDDTQAIHARRASVMAIVGLLGKDTNIIEQARDALRVEAKKPSSLEPNMAQIATRIVARVGDLAHAERTMELYQTRRKKGLAPQAQSRHLIALSAFEDPSAVDAILSWTLPSAPAHQALPQDQLGLILNRFLANPRCQERTWTFLEQEWQHIAPRVGGMGISRLVEAMGALPKNRWPAIQELLRKHPVPQAERALNKAHENMQIQARFRTKQRSVFAAWLQKV